MSTELETKVAIPEEMQLHELIEMTLNHTAVLHRHELSRRQKTGQPTHLYPSRIGQADNCLGRVFRDIVDWNRIPAPPINLLRIFEAGNQAEDSIVMNLFEEFTRQQIGIEEIEFQVPAKFEPLRLSCRCDAVAKIGGKRYVIEIKSASTYSWEKFVDENVMRQDDSFHRLYFWQCICYHVVYNVDVVFLLARGKESNEYKCIPIYRNEEAIQQLYRWSSEIWDAVAEFNQTGAEPDGKFFTPSKYVCTNCQHREYCIHGNKFDDLQTIDSEETEKKIMAWNALEPFAKEYEKLDAELKSSLKSHARLTFDDAALRKGAKVLINGKYMAKIKTVTKKNPPKPGGPDTVYQKVEIEKVIP